MNKFLHRYKTNIFISDSNDRQDKNDYMYTFYTQPIKFYEYA